MPKASLKYVLRPDKKLNRKKILKKQLAKESKLAEKSSLEVLREFEALDDPIFE